MRDRSATKTLREISVLKTIAKKRMDEVKENRAEQSSIVSTEAEQNSSTFRTYSKADAVKWLGIEYPTTFSRAFEGIKAKYPDRVFNRENNKNYAFTVSDLHFFADELDIPKFVRKENQECITIAFSNLKGGVGKTTTCVNVATGLAVSNNKRYRVGVIDLDPQGTASLFGVPNLSEDDFTVGDILQSNYELEQGDCEKQFISECFKETSIPNLKYLPAKVPDYFFESYAEQLQINDTLKNKADVYKIFKEKVIDAVKDEFDIILIDTPPSLNKTFYNAMYAADAVITPTKPEMLSFDATMKYMERFEDIYKMVAHAGHKGFYFLRMLAVDVDTSRALSKNNIGMTYFSMMKKYFRDRVISVPMKHSKAIQICADFFTTVYGMKPSEYPGSREQLTDAQNNMDDLVSEIELLCQQAWHPNEFEGL
ncbi:ParA family protein [Thalassotalea sp. PLHSN55]|uniref:ParA family protein n=1 Tax=Thalassotalea sp. PLHSN55 TaxID=3435888 RepID=UPI003F8367EF